VAEPSARVVERSSAHKRTADGCSVEAANIVNREPAREHGDGAWEHVAGMAADWQWDFDELADTAAVGVIQQEWVLV
jgi:hypothetical protein